MLFYVTMLSGCQGRLEQVWAQHKLVLEKATVAHEDVGER